MISERKVDEVVRKVIALRELRTMITTRAQNVALQTLTDEELAVAVLRIKESGIQ